MYEHILNLMEDYKDKVSFYPRMKQLQAFMERHQFLQAVYDRHPDVPLTIIMAVSTSFPEVFKYQLNSILQFPEILQDGDQLVIVADEHRQEDVTNMVADLSDYVNTAVVFIDRKVPGDRPTLNWDIGLSYAVHDRILFMRDLCLPFSPWDLIKLSRYIGIEDKLTNFSVVLGPPFSRFYDQWLYLVHPFFSPAPLLFSFVASKKNLLAVNGFDRVFARGFDHSGELDFLLRWASKGFTYDISDKVELLHPGLPVSNIDLEAMQFQSSINRRYFYDRYGEAYVDGLKPPYRLDMTLIEVIHAKTFTPMMGVASDTPGLIEGKDVCDFSKRPDSFFVVKEV